MNRRLLVCLAALLLADGAAAADLARPDVPPSKRQAYFGELHLHTSMSFDAWTFGTKVTPDQAYRFARGETIQIPASQVAMQQQIAGTGTVAATRAWPLDFAAVTDHAEYMGVLRQLDDPGSAPAQSGVGKKILEHPLKAFALIVGSKDHGASILDAFNAKQAMRDAWAAEVKAANDDYQPGKFTTFVAYEWTSDIEGKNLHRNVIFDADHAPLPFTSADSRRPEDLWAYLDKVRTQGIDVLAIPHNGNVSGGLMYDWDTSDGRPIDEAYAQERALNEPLTEIVQNKGQSETVPALSPDDAFANFEIYDHLLSRPDVKSAPDGSYIRQAFGRGLMIQQRTGANPFKYGVVGASDIHNGLSASDESAMAGGPFTVDPKTMLPSGDAAKFELGIIKKPTPLETGGKPIMQNNLEFSSPGITGVWAEENTRPAIFAALKRKETFATSGTRIRVRMFGGWRFAARDLKSPDWLARAYAEGVPMGGDLPARPAGAAAPRFIVQAIKDGNGANLDRIQIVKVWLAGGNYREKIFDVALSGNRRPNPKTGRIAPVGDSVDLKTGRYTNAIGAAVLTAVWRDPEFDPHTPAVYYSRTLEIPTPRWSTLLAIRNSLPIPADVPATIQERAWTSPIWYTPRS